jgi:argininosuccinate lyase
LNKLTTKEIKKSVQGTKVDPKIVSEIIKSTTVVSSLKDRISFGSSGYAEQKRMIQDRIKKINDYRTNTTKRENEISNALENLAEKISVLIK